MSNYLVPSIITSIVILLILTVIIILVVINPGPNCNCPAGYICQDQVCKAVNGSFCNKNSDCATGLTCINNVCLIPSMDLVPAPINTKSAYTNYDRKNISTKTVYTNIAQKSISNSDLKSISNTKTSCSNSDQKSTINTKTVYTNIPQKSISNSDQKSTSNTKSSCSNSDQKSISNTKSPYNNNDQKSISNTKSSCSNSDQKSTSNTKSACSNSDQKSISTTSCSIIEYARKHYNDITPINSSSKSSYYSDKFKTKQTIEPTSTDDEYNSEGSLTDAQFDIRSGTSTNDNITTEDNSPYPIIKEQAPLHQIIDVCTYSTANLFLTDKNIIIKELPNQAKLFINLNMPLLSIVNFKGLLYGLNTNYQLVVFNIEDYGSENWSFRAVDWAPNSIKNINSTLNGEYLWVYDGINGYLYSDINQLSEKIETTRKRIYGKDQYHYIDIDQKEFTGKLYPNGKEINKIYDGCLNYYNELTIISQNERDKYTSVKILNWNPYYIKPIVVE